MTSFTTTTFSDEFIVDFFDSHLNSLFPLNRSLTGEANRTTLNAINKIIPLQIVELASGTSVFDWTIPPEWSVTEAWISDQNGTKIVDFSENNLHLCSYSTPIDKFLMPEDLLPHIHTHQSLHDAIPYRTNYYSNNWGFSVRYDQYERIKSSSKPLHVYIDSSLHSGHLTYGECLIPGKYKEEILISSYICHPSMANDSLSGVLLSTLLAKYLLTKKQLKWSYRFVFVPETIGAIAYCHQNYAAIREIDFGFVVTTVGGPGKFSYKQSYDKTHPVNHLVESTFSQHGVDFITYPFDIHGSDERQYSSQGFKVNIASIFKDRYYEYEYYHTSLDDLSFVTPKSLLESFRIYQSLFDKIESRLMYRNNLPNCEVMLSKHDLYPLTGGAQLPELGGKSELDLLLWLLYLCDGRNHIEYIADFLKVPVSALLPLIDKLANKGVLEHV